jgi:carbon monoxide dehydrogenase subunit G
VTTFSVSTASRATVDADRQRVWVALTDPDLIVRLTPYLSRIDAVTDHGVDRWTWQLVRIPLLGSMVSPSFTEVMTYDEPSRIEFVHDPARTDEKAGVDGRYVLKEAGQGTDLSIDLAITVELPFPKLARPAVHAAMRAVIATMGARFSHNLVRHLATDDA